jgi:hypothetical protein
MNGVTLPNVSNSNFLMGSTTAGTAGGAASYALIEANIAGHTHTIDNSHANTFALSNATTASSSHTHGIAHAHQYITRDYNLLSVFADMSLTSLDDSVTSISGSDVTLYNWIDNNNSNSAGNATMGRQISNSSLYTTGVLSPPTGSDGASAASGTPSATQVVTLSGSVTNYTGSSGSAGSGTAISLLPAYITTRYAIRYK